MLGAVAIQPSVCWLDFGDVGTKVGQKQDAQRTSDSSRQIEDADVPEGVHALQLVDARGVPRRDELDLIGRHVGEMLP
jgi:hypothetical protein